MASSEIGDRIAAFRSSQSPKAWSLQDFADAVVSAGGKANRASVWEWEQGGRIAAPNLAAIARVMRLDDAETGRLLESAYPGPVEDDDAKAAS